MHYVAVSTEIYFASTLSHVHAQAEQYAWLEADLQVSTGGRRETRLTMARLTVAMRTMTLITVAVYFSDTCYRGTYYCGTYMGVLTMPNQMRVLQGARPLSTCA